jgi:hypothetical protein
VLGEAAMLFVWFPILLSVIFTLGAAAGVIRDRVRAARRLPALRRRLDVLASGLGSERAGDQFSATHEHLRFDVRLAVSLGASESLEIATSLDEVTREVVEAPRGYRGSPSARVNGRPTILLSRKTWWTTLGERLRARRAPDTGDSAFDQAFSIKTSAPSEDLRRVFSEPRARRALLDLVKAGADRITINDDRAALSVAFIAPHEDKVNVFTFLDAASGIAAAAPYLPVFGASDPARRRFPVVGALWALAITALLAAPLVISRSFYAWPFLAITDPLWPSVTSARLAIGLAVWALALPILALALRGRRAALRHRFAMAVAVLMTLPAYGTGAAFALNAMLDTTVISRAGTVRLLTLDSDPPLISRAGTVNLLTLDSDPPRSQHYVVLDPPSPDAPPSDLPAMFELPSAFHDQVADCTGGVIVTMARGILGGRLLRDIRCRSSWVPLSATHDAPQPPWEDRALVIEKAGVFLQPSTNHTIELYADLWNEAKAPRWLILPRHTDRPGISAGQQIHSVSAHALGGRGRVIVVELLHEDGGGSQAFLIPGRSGISIDRLKITTSFLMNPTFEVAIDVIAARELTVAGVPLDEWFEEIPVSQRGASVVDGRGGGAARALNIRPELKNRLKIAFDVETRARALLRRKK